MTKMKMYKEDVLILIAAAACFLLIAVGCSDPPEEVASPLFPAGYMEPIDSTLPVCAPTVGVDHYCANGKVACWDNTVTPWVGASGCSTEILHSVERPRIRVECVPGCLEGPPPPVTCSAVKSVKWCGNDASGLKRAVCEGLGDCISDAPFPPYRLHCVKACP